MFHFFQVHNLIMLVTILLLIGLELGFCFKFFHGNKSSQNLPIEIFDQFEGFTRLIYFDNSTIDFVETILTETKYSVTNTLLENIHNDFHQNSIRNYSNQFYSFFLTPNIKQQRIRLFSKLKINDVLLFFTDNFTNTTCTTEKYPQTRGVFFFNTMLDQLFCCLFFRNQEWSITKIIEKSNGKFPNLMSFFNNYSDLGGYEFRVGYSNFSPAIFWR